MDNDETVDLIAILAAIVKYRHPLNPGGWASGSPFFRSAKNDW